MILWLMPVQVIGEKNRKGTLGSPYAVKDYYAVEPSLGTIDDLRHFVHAAHDLRDVRHPGLGREPHGLGQQPGHRASRVVRPGLEGDFHPTPWWDWVDIIDLDYDNAELREYMTNAMKLLGVGSRCRRLPL